MIPWDDLQVVMDRIRDEIRPRLDQHRLDGGYDCCGCSTYEQIVEDIEAIIRETKGEQALSER